MRAFCLPLSWALVLLGGISLSQLLPGLVCSAKAEETFCRPEAVESFADDEHFWDRGELPPPDPVLMHVENENDLVRWLSPQSASGEESVQQKATSFENYEAWEWWTEPSWPATSDESHGNTMESSDSAKFGAPFEHEADSEMGGSSEGEDAAQIQPDSPSRYEYFVDEYHFRYGNLLAADAQRQSTNIPSDGSRSHVATQSTIEHAGCWPQSTTDYADDYADPEWAIYGYGCSGSQSFSYETAAERKTSTRGATSCDFGRETSQPTASFEGLTEAYSAEEPVYGDAYWETAQQTRDPANSSENLPAYAEWECQYDVWSGYSESNVCTAESQVLETEFRSHNNWATSPIRDWDQPTFDSESSRSDAARVKPEGRESSWDDPGFWCKYYGYESSESSVDEAAADSGISQSEVMEQPVGDPSATEPYSTEETDTWGSYSRYHEGPYGYMRYRAGYSSWGDALKDETTLTTSRFADTGFSADVSAETARDAAEPDLGVTDSAEMSGGSGVTRFEYPEQDWAQNYDEFDGYYEPEDYGPYGQSSSPSQTAGAKWNFEGLNEANFTEQNRGSATSLDGLHASQLHQPFEPLSTTETDLAKEACIQDAYGEGESYESAILEKFYGESRGGSAARPQTPEPFSRKQASQGSAPTSPANSNGVLSGDKAQAWSPNANLYPEYVYPEDQFDWSGTESAPFSWELGSPAMPAPGRGLNQIQDSQSTSEEAQYSDYGFQGYPEYLSEYAEDHPATTKENSTSSEEWVPEDVCEEDWLGDQPATNEACEDMQGMSAEEYPCEDYQWSVEASMTEWDDPASDSQEILGHEMSQTDAYDANEDEALSEESWDAEDVDIWKDAGEPSGDQADSTMTYEAFGPAERSAYYPWEGEPGYPWGIEEAERGFHCTDSWAEPKPEAATIEPRETQFSDSACVDELKNSLSNFGRQEHGISPDRAKYHWWCAEDPYVYSEGVDLTHTQYGAQATASEASPSFTKQTLSLPQSPTGKTVSREDGSSTWSWDDSFSRLHGEPGEPLYTYEEEFGESEWLELEESGGYPYYGRPVQESEGNFGEFGPNDFGVPRGKASPGSSMFDSSELTPSRPSEQSSLIQSGLELFALHARDLLSSMDIDLLRQLNEMATEPATIRATVLEEYLSVLGWHAGELAARLESLTGLGIIHLARDPADAAALLAACRLVERDELGLEEAVRVLRRTLENRSSNWGHQVAELLGDWYEADGMSDGSANDLPANTAPFSRAEKNKGGKSDSLPPRSSSQAADHGRKAVDQAATSEEAQAIAANPLGVAISAVTESLTWGIHTVRTSVVEPFVEAVEEVIQEQF